MSHPGLVHFVGRKLRVAVLATSIVMVAPVVVAGPQLWLYPAGAGPREGGHVVPPGEFTLVIENRAKGSGDDTAYEVGLVIAVENLEAVSTLSLDGEMLALDPGEWDEGTPSLPCGNKPMPRHGVFPSTYTIVDLDDLDGGMSFQITVLVEGTEDLRVHFDAIAHGLKTTGQGQKCFGIANPPGHDVTVANRRGQQDFCGQVSITKTADPSSIDLAQEVGFVIEVLNTGTCDLTDVVLQDKIPAVEDEEGNLFPAFEWIGGDNPPSQIDAFLLEWPLDPLPVGDSAIVELVVLFNEPLADQQRVVNRACVDATEMRKPRCTAALVMVGNPFGEDGPAGPGFWCHAARWVLEGRVKLPVGGDELLEWLASVDGASEVYSELYPIFDEADPEASLVAAADLLCTPQSPQGPAGRLARHLLVLWLNVVSGRLDPALKLGELCMGDEILPEDADPDMTVGELLETVDAAFADADDDQKTFWAELIDAVNNAYVDGEGVCDDLHRTSRRARGGYGNSGDKLVVSHGKD